MISPSAYQLAGLYCSGQAAVAHQPDDLVRGLEVIGRGCAEFCGKIGACSGAELLGVNPEFQAVPPGGAGGLGEKVAQNAAPVA